MSGPDRRLLARIGPLSPWEVLRLTLATYPTEPTLLMYATWSLVWGLCVLADPWNITGAAACRWMTPIPAALWGAVFALKGGWQWVITLRSLSRVFRGERPERGLLSQHNAVNALNLGLSVVMVFGYARESGPLATYTAFYVVGSVLTMWHLLRSREAEDVRVMEDEREAEDARA